MLRADLEFALYLGTATRFSTKDVMITSNVLHEVSNEDTEALSEYPEDTPSLVATRFIPGLRDIFTGIARFAWIINDITSGKREKIHNYPFHDTIIMLGYRLVDVAPLGGLMECHVAHTMHLGLAAFLMTFLRRLDYIIPDMPLLYKLYQAAITQLSDDEDENQELRLWAVFIGRASIFQSTDDDWLLPIATKTAQRLNLCDWADIRQVLSRWPWVTSLHDNAGEALWHRSTSVV